MPSACSGRWEGASGGVSSSLGHEDTFGRGVAQALLDGWSRRPQPSFPGVALVVFSVLIPPLLVTRVLSFNRQLKSVYSRGKNSSTARQQAAGEGAHLDSQTCTSSCVKVFLVDSRAFIFSGINISLISNTLLCYPIRDS